MWCDVLVVMKCECVYISVCSHSLSLCFCVCVLSACKLSNIWGEWWCFWRLTYWIPVSDCIYLEDMVVSPFYGVPAKTALRMIWFGWLLKLSSCLIGDQCWRLAMMHECTRDYWLDCWLYVAPWDDLPILHDVDVKRGCFHRFPVARRSGPCLELCPCIRRDVCITFYSARWRLMSKWRWTCRSLDMTCRVSDVHADIIIFFDFFFFRFSVIYNWLGCIHFVWYIYIV